MLSRCGVVTFEEELIDTRPAPLRQRFATQDWHKAAPVPLYDITWVGQTLSIF